MVDGTVAGAVYTPADVICPTVEFPPATLFTLQVTPVAAAPERVAVKVCVIPLATVAVAGETVRAAAGVCVTVTVAEANWLESAALVAFTVTGLGVGRDAGAVYKPDVDTVPTVELPPATPLTLQFRFVFELPVTVAVNCSVPFSATEAVAGLIVTETPPG